MVFAAAYSFDAADFHITADYDICGDIDNIPVQRAGVEIRTPYLLVLRAGYQTDNTTVSGFKDITFGRRAEHIRKIRGFRVRAIRRPWKRI